MATRLVEIGLASMFLAIPSSVLAGAMGPYDEPKVWALVVGVGLTGLACLTGRALGASPSPTLRPDRALRAVRWTVGAYGAWLVLATGLSIATGQSLWGGFGRGFGLVAILAAFAVFLIVQAEIRTLDRLSSLIDVVLIGSLPVVLLALGQALGQDPLPPGWDPAAALLRVRSTFGHHIFLGSYLIALISLGVGRLMAARSQPSRLSGVHIAVATAWVLGTVGLLGSAHHGSLTWCLILAWGVAGGAAWSMAPAFSGASLPPNWRIALLGSLVIVQVVVLVLSAARGALVGLVVGLVVASGVALVFRRAARTLAIFGTGVLALALFVAALNLGLAPLDRLRSIRAFERLSAIGALREGTPEWVRVRLWRGIASGWVRWFAGNEDVPSSAPWPRTLVGYGPETQILVLDRFLPAELRSLRGGQRDWTASYTFDRAHNELLDHLVTTGAIGMLLWVGLVSSVVITGVMRLRSASGAVDAGARLGCLALVLGQFVEGLFGIASPVPRALFWMAAAILTLPFPLPPTAVSVESRNRAPRAKREKLRWPAFALLGSLIAAVSVAVVGTTRALQGSMAYAAGNSRWIAGDLATARREFVRASGLAPWLPFPAEAAADVSLRLMAAESNRPPRVDWLTEAQEALDRARRHVPSRGHLWLASAQVELARASAGQPERLDAAFRDFQEADRLSPANPDILARWALAMVQTGDPRGGLRLAERALEIDRGSWLAWSVFARSCGQLGDSARAQFGAGEARRLAPPAARPLVERLLQ
jgi:cytochrome c-type biogenesis protein CcmH/NrfG